MQHIVLELEPFFSLLRPYFKINIGDEKLKNWSYRKKSGIEWQKVLFCHTSLHYTTHPRPVDQEVEARIARPLNRNKITSQNPAFWEFSKDCCVLIRPNLRPGHQDESEVAWNRRRTPPG
jgi:hypothetical protein